MAKPVKPKKPRANQYVMPEPLPKDEVLTDLTKGKWRIGPSIGKGGFGEIYSAQSAEKKSTSYPFVVKIEPHGNGPLFVEMHFYMKNCKQEDIEQFKSKNKLKSLGMPVFWGSGSHEFNGEKYRFIVMDKFGSDIDKLLKENNGTFTEATVFKLALQMTYVLQYIHEFGYVHADLKGANILMGVTPETKDQAFLVDFGLATKFTTDKVFKPNPKKAHDGTIEYLSRDAHKGVPTRRGDFEILGYNIIHWLGGKLPWLNKLSDPNAVHASKEEAMDKLENLLQKSFGSQLVPDGLLKFLKYVKTLKFDQEPNYKKIREIFVAAIVEAGSSVTSPMEFGLKKSQMKRKSLNQAGSPNKKAKSPEKVATPKKVGKKKQGVATVTEGKEVKGGKMPPKKVVKKKQELVTNNEEVMTPAMLELMEKKVTNKKRNNLPKGSPSKANGAVKKTLVAKKTTKKKIDTIPDVEMVEVENVKGKSVNEEDMEQEEVASNGLDGFNDEMKEVMLKKMKNNVTKKTNKNRDQPAGSDSHVNNRPRRGMAAVNYKDN